MGFVYAGRTDVGRRRFKNEDALLIERDLSVIAVADGMGGAASGEVASALFIETVLEVFSAAKVSREDLRTVVEKVFVAANAKVISDSMRNEDNRGMGCTAEVWAADGDTYVVGHIGDSRTYVLRGGELKQLTRDHSIVQDEIDRGLITAEQAKVHLLRNVVTRAIGVSVSLSVDIIHGVLGEQDIFVLCSDGLTDMLTDTEIARILSTTADLDQAAEKLVEAANIAGGRDNITVGLVRPLR
jgi:PPM family protein phosphatase